MSQFIYDHYLTLKALHLIAMVAWMAAMLYLPRLFVYHSAVAVGSESSELFKVMERRLLKAIMTPAMIGTFLLGGVLINAVGFSGNGWLHIKLLLVLILAGLHGMMAKYVKDFARDANTRSQRYYRYFNEVPAVLMVVIVLLVVTKPF